MARGLIKEILSSEAVRYRAIDLMFPATKEEAKVLTGRQKVLLNMRVPWYIGDPPYTQPEAAHDLGVSVRTVQRDEVKIREVILSQ